MVLPAKNARSASCARAEGAPSASTSAAERARVSHVAKHIILVITGLRAHCAGAHPANLKRNQAPIPSAPATNKCKRHQTATAPELDADQLTGKLPAYFLLRITDDKLCSRGRRHLYQISRMLIAVALAIALVGCGKATQGEKGDAGPAGPPGAKGDAGPLDPTRVPREHRARCGSCAPIATRPTARRNAATMVLLCTAYCGPTRIVATFPTERSATCRARTPANSPLIAACAKASP